MNIDHIHWHDCVDVGPAIGLWYLVGTILMWRSISWVRDTAKERYGQPRT